MWLDSHGPTTEWTCLPCSLIKANMVYHNGHNGQHDKAIFNEGQCRKHDLQEFDCSVLSVDDKAKLENLTVLSSY